MSKKITIDLDSEEMELLETMNSTIDFYGDGYDDGKDPNQRDSDVIMEGFMNKLREEYNKP